MIRRQKNDAWTDASLSNLSNKRKVILYDDLSDDTNSKRQKLANQDVNSLIKSPDDSDRNRTNPRISKINDNCTQSDKRNSKIKENHNIHNRSPRNRTELKTKESSEQIITCHPHVNKKSHPHVDNRIISRHRNSGSAESSQRQMISLDRTKNIYSRNKNDRINTKYIAHQNPHENRRYVKEHCDVGSNIIDYKVLSKIKDNSGHVNVPIQNSNQTKDLKILINQNNSEMRDSYKLEITNKSSIQKINPVKETPYTDNVNRRLRRPLKVNVNSQQLFKEPMQCSSQSYGTNVIDNDVNKLQKHVEPKNSLESKVYVQLLNESSNQATETKSIEGNRTGHWLDSKIKSSSDRENCAQKPIQCSCHIEGAKTADYGTVESKTKETNEPTDKARSLQIKEPRFIDDSKVRHRRDSNTRKSMEQIIPTVKDATKKCSQSKDHQDATIHPTTASKQSKTIDSIKRDNPKKQTTDKDHSRIISSRTRRRSAPSTKSRPENAMLIQSITQIKENPNIDNQLKRTANQSPPKRNRQIIERPKFDSSRRKCSEQEAVSIQLAAPSAKAEPLTIGSNSEGKEKQARVIITKEASQRGQKSADVDVTVDPKHTGRRENSKQEKTATPSRQSGADKKTPQKVDKNTITDPKHSEMKCTHKRESSTKSSSDTGVMRRRSLPESTVISKHVVASPREIVESPHSNNQNIRSGKHSESIKNAISPISGHLKGSQTICDPSKEKQRIGQETAVKEPSQSGVRARESRGAIRAGRHSEPNPPQSSTGNDIELQRRSKAKVQQQTQCADTTKEQSNSGRATKHISAPDSELTKQLTPSDSQTESIDRGRTDNQQRPSSGPTRDPPISRDRKHSGTKSDTERQHRAPASGKPRTIRGRGTMGESRSKDITAHQPSPSAQIKDAANPDNSNHGDQATSPAIQHSDRPKELSNVADSNSTLKPESTANIRQEPPRADVTASDRKRPKEVIVPEKKEHEAKRHRKDPETDKATGPIASQQPIKEPHRVDGGRKRRRSPSRSKDGSNRSHSKPSRHRKSSDSKRDSTGRSDSTKVSKSSSGRRDPERGGGSRKRRRRRTSAERAEGVAVKAVTVSRRGAGGSTETLDLGSEYGPVLLVTERAILLPDWIYL